MSTLAPDICCYNWTFELTTPFRHGPCLHPYQSISSNLRWMFDLLFPRSDNIPAADGKFLFRPVIRVSKKAPTNASFHRGIAEMCRVIALTSIILNFSLKKTPSESPCLQTFPQKYCLHAFWFNNYHQTGLWN